MLNEFIKESRKKRLFQSSYDLQKEILCQTSDHPLKELSKDDIHSLLLSYGLFKPEAWRRAQELVTQWKIEGLFQKIDQEYQRLKREWQGPEVPLYVYPFNEGGLFHRREHENKGGVAFKEAIYLFYGKPVKKDDWKAVLAHEYNHVCRLTEKGINLNHVSLLESLVIEGLGEYAVYTLYGGAYTAPWTKQYKDEKLEELWKSKFRPSLKNRGQKNHLDFLYGSNRKGLPKWSGYQLGYKIIESYHNAHPEESLRTMLKKDGKTLLNGSSFP
ncbi:DUF2268 domain-containing protein [Halobacillus litoralis]|uniref:DUF2268 domain-containing protein n=1 Tax=Halobacillus litoralis TaxID=45668 RepID=UPI001CFDA4E3|nr:DUF2268 domain-containing putative Zn-dependent protease [Halobacillus litoralis]